MASIRKHAGGAPYITFKIIPKLKDVPVAEILEGWGRELERLGLDSTLRNTFCINFRITMYCQETDILRG
jgi:hypothetical protein